MFGWQDWINRAVDWYYQPSNSKFDYETKQFMGNLPIIGGLLRAGDSGNQMDDFLRNRGLNYSDIRYNSAPFGTSPGGAVANAGVSAMNLYRSAARSRRSPSGSRSTPVEYMSGTRPRGGWSTTNPNRRYKTGHDRYHNNQFVSHKKYRW